MDGLFNNGADILTLRYLYNEKRITGLVYNINKIITLLVLLFESIRILVIVISKFL